MPSCTSVPTSPTMDPTSPQSTKSAQATAVLDRVAARVQQRLATEQAATNRVGDGAHAASLNLAWPL